MKPPVEKRCRGDSYCFVRGVTCRTLALSILLFAFATSLAFAQRQKIWSEFDKDDWWVERAAVFFPRYHFTLASTNPSLQKSAPSAPDAILTSATWSATPTSANWVTTGAETNWSTGIGTFPGATAGLTNGDTATFTGASTQLSITINSATLNIKSITFSGASEPAYTIGTTGGNSLLLTSGGSISIASNVTGASITNTVNAPLVLEPVSATTAGTYSFSNDSTIASHPLVIGGTVTGGTTTQGITLTLAGANTGANAVSGIISDGSASLGLALVKTAAGTWTLSGANTYSGGTTINQGVLQMSGSGTLGSTTATLNLSGTGQLNLGGTSQTVGAIVITAPTTSTTMLIGTGTLTLNGNLSYSAPGNNNFPVTLGATTATVLDLGGGTRNFNITGNNNSAGDVIVNALIQNGGINYVGTLGGPGGVTPPVMNFLSANTYSLGTTVSGVGILQLGASDVVSGGVISTGPVGRGLLTLGTGTTLRSTSSTARTLENNLSLSGNVVFGATSTQTGALTFDSVGLTTPSTVALTANTQLTTNVPTNINNVISGSFDLTKAGATVLNLGAANTFSGTFTASASTTNLNVNGALGSVTAITIGTGATVQSGFTTLTNVINDAAAVTINGTGILDLSGGTETIGSLASTSSTASVVTGVFSASPGSLTVGDSSSTSFAGVISTFSASTGTVFTKQGSGTLTLTGANTYTGETLIATSGGTLRLDSAGSTTARLTATSKVTVNTGGTLLLANSSGTASSDRINNTATMTLNGGTLRLDTGTISEGTNAATGVGALTLSANSTINLAGNNILHFATSTTATGGTVLSILNWNGLVTGNAATGGSTTDLFRFGTANTDLSFISQIQFVDPNGVTGTYAAMFASLNGGEVVPDLLTPVPEPSTWIGAALAVVVIGYSQRKRLAPLVRQAA